MKIGLTYNQRPHGCGPQECGDDAFAEFDSPETVDILLATLKRLGHDPIAIGDGIALIDILRAGVKFDLIFNIAEGKHFQSREAQVPAILELFEVPYTFGDPLCTCICLNKWFTKQILLIHGIPTPPSFLAATGSGIRRDYVLPWEAFVKPNHEGTSKGIDAGAIVFSTTALRSRVDFVCVKYGQLALIERRIRGSEYTVAIVNSGDQANVIGSAKISLATGRDVYGITEKEKCENLVHYQYETLEKQYLDMALAAYRATGCRDAGRVDLIIDDNGTANILEVNPIPGLHPTHSDLPIIAAFAGMSYGELLSVIVSSASKRTTGLTLDSEAHWLISQQLPH